MENDCEPESIEDVLDCVEEAARDDRRVSLGEIVANIGEGAFAPVLLIPALVMVSPATAIFGVATVCGFLIILISLQMVFGRQKLWLPRWILDRSISRQRLDKVLEWLNRPARFVDSLARRRISVLVEPPMTRVWALICLMLSLVVPIFELVPMSATIIGAAIALFALAMVAKDGLFALLGLAILATAFWLFWTAAT